MAKLTVKVECATGVVPSFEETRELVAAVDVLKMVSPTLGQVKLQRTAGTIYSYKEVWPGPRVWEVNIDVAGGLASVDFSPIGSAWFPSSEMVPTQVARRAASDLVTKMPNIDLVKVDWE